MENMKKDRLLEIFYMALCGKELSVRALADEYGTAQRTVSRDIKFLREFFEDHRELVGHTELVYSNKSRTYRLEREEFLSAEELFAVVKILISARGFSKLELMNVIEKLKKFTTEEHRKELEEIILNEVGNYVEVRHDCNSVTATVWQLVKAILDQQEVSIDYYRMDRAYNTYRLRPVSVMFEDMYFYLIAYDAKEEELKPKYFRIDRIKHITCHRQRVLPDKLPAFGAGELRKKSLLMWPGVARTIRFEFTGPSVQAVLDKLQTATVIRQDGRKYLVEAQVYGDGVKMWLLSQGAWVKVLSPPSLVDEMRDSVREMMKQYEEGEQE